LRKIALVCLILCAPSAAFSQAPILSIEPASMSLPVRSDAPVTVFFRIRSQATNLIEGRLEVAVHDGLDTLAQVELNDLVVSAGDQIVRMVLPPIESNNPYDQVLLKVAFVGKNFKFSTPEEFPLRALGQWKRGFVILIPDPLQVVDRGTQQLFEHLRFENWNAEKGDVTVTTIPAHARPEDLPADPLGYCGFDVAVVAGAGLAEMKESQLRALFDWVAAGGSVCVIPGQSILKDYHARLLNDIARTGDEEVPFLLDSTGRISPPDDEASERPLLVRHGLGRVAVVRGRLDSLLVRTLELREMLAFLWKLRRDRHDEFVAKGTFLIAREAPPAQEQDPQQIIMQAQTQIQKAQLEINQAQAKMLQAQANKSEAELAQAQSEMTQAQTALAQAQTQMQNAYVNSRNFSYADFRPKEKQLAQLPLKSGDQLVSRLLPQGLRFVPMSLVGLILVVYVLLIGPGDWFILGAIRRRKWTWFTFPAVTITLTLATVWLAEWYMQVSDNRRAVTFHDVGLDGRTIRRNRFEVLFLGSEREVRTELSREIFSPMSLQRFSEAIGYRYPGQMQEDDSKRLRAGVARYTGRIPTSYGVAQFITQWTPQLNRRFAIPAGEKPGVEFDWNAFADSNTYNFTSLATGPVRNELLEKVRQAFGADANVAILSNGKRNNLAGAFDFLQGTGLYGVDQYGNQIATPYYRYNMPQKTSNFLDDVSVNSLGGLFAVVSQTSPSGGKDFEDMALLDPSDPDQWLLIVAVDRGDEVDIYRKLYAGGK
jgi:hypothetical protein